MLISFPFVPDEVHRVISLSVGGVIATFAAIFLSFTAFEARYWFPQTQCPSPMPDCFKGEIRRFVYALGYGILVMLVGLWAVVPVVFEWFKVYAGVMFGAVREAFK